MYCILGNLQLITLPITFYSSPTSQLPQKSSSREIRTIDSYQPNSSVYLLISFLEVKKLHRKMVAMNFLFDLDTFKSCDLIGY